MKFPTPALRAAAADLRVAYQATPRTEPLDVLVDLIHANHPNVHLVTGPLAPVSLPSDSAGSAPPSGRTPLVYDDGVVQVVGDVTPEALLKAVEAAHRARALLLDTTPAGYDPPTRFYADFDTTVAEEQGIRASQAAERARVLRLLASPGSRPASAAELEWVADVIQVWTDESKHPLDLARDPQGFGLPQTNRSYAMHHVNSIAKEAATAWRAGTPGTVAEDAPEVAWEVLRAMVLHLLADNLEVAALLTVLPERAK